MELVLLILKGQELKYKCNFSRKETKVAKLFKIKVKKKQSKQLINAMKKVIDREKV